MRKLTIFIAMMLVLSYCVGSCASQDYECSEDIAAPSATQSRGLPQFSDNRRQYTEVIRHTKFEEDTFYLDITLEKALQKGVSADVYNKWLEQLEEYTIKARKTIANGGKFYFVNGLIENEDLSNNNSSGRAYVSPNYGGYLEAPPYNIRDIYILSMYADIYKGVAFSCFANLVMKAAGGDYTGFVRHECRLSGKNKDGNTVEDGIIAIGSPNATAIKVVPFPGLLGDSAEHTVAYDVELVNSHGGDSIAYAYCLYQAVTYL